MFFLLFVSAFSLKSYHCRPVRPQTREYEKPRANQLKIKDIPYWGIGPVLPRPAQNATANGGFVKRGVSLDANSKPQQRNSVQNVPFIRRVESMDLESNKKEVEEIKRAKAQSSPFIKRYESFNPEANAVSRLRDPFVSTQPVRLAKFLKRSKTAANGVQKQEFVKRVESF